METDVEGNSCRLVGSYKTGGCLEGLRNITKKNWSELRSSSYDSWIENFSLGH